MTSAQAARDAEAEDNADWMLEKTSSASAKHDNAGNETARQTQQQQQQKRASLVTGAAGSLVAGSQAVTVGSSVTGTMGGTGMGIGGIGGAVDGMDEEETREAVFWRLDGLGYRVGLGLVDRYVATWELHCLMKTELTSAVF